MPLKLEGFWNPFEFRSESSSYAASQRSTRAALITCPRYSPRSAIHCTIIVRFSRERITAANRAGQPVVVSTPIDKTRLNQLAAAAPDNERQIVTVPFADVAACPVDRAQVFTQGLVR